jgi:uncharacterized membrane protein (DUF4010 family)
MAQANLFYRFGAALAIGALIGLEREHSHRKANEELFAGVRTFPLIAIMGCLAALMSEQLGAWPFVGAIVIFGLLVTVAYFVESKYGDTGLTTEVSALVTFLVGALCYWDYLPLAVAISVAMTLLLSLKPEIRSLAYNLTQEDIYATLKFAVVSAIVLPVLPNQAFGPLDVLNPYKIWLMVVFISGISFLGYLLIKVVGPEQGIGLTGLLGGIASSTATTMSFSRRSHQDRELAKPFAMAIMIAWTVMFARVLIIVGALSLTLLQSLWMPIAASVVVGVAYCAYLYFSQRTDETGQVEYSNPFELGPALTFGVLYAVMLVVSKATEIYLGDTGLYISSIVAGLSDVDAISLSLVNLFKDPNGIGLAIASRAIVLASLSNTAVKGGIALTTGTPELRRAIWPGFLLMIGTGLGVAFLV